MTDHPHPPSEPCQVRKGTRVGGISPILQMCKLRLWKGRDSPEVPQGRVLPLLHPAPTTDLRDTQFPSSLTSWDVPWKGKAMCVVLLYRSQPGPDTLKGAPGSAPRLQEASAEAPA